MKILVIVKSKNRNKRSREDSEVITFLINKNFFSDENNNFHKKSFVLFHKNI